LTTCWRSWFEFSKTLLKLPLHGADGVVESFAASCCLSRGRALRADYRRAGEEENQNERVRHVHHGWLARHSISIGNFTKEATCSFFRMAMALAICSAAALAGCYTQPSGDAVPMPAALPLRLT
jgi:hypothetical protein